MNTGLVTKTFRVKTRFFSYPAKFIAPIWAKGFECQIGLCGLCCITGTPGDIRLKHNAQLDRSICGFYDVERSTCQRYAERPEVCRMYPFLYGVEDGQVLVSTSLDCPATNSESTISRKVLLDLFKVPFVNQTITVMNDSYEMAVLNPLIWDRADSVWQMLKSKVQRFFDKVTNFPFLSEATIQIYEPVANVLKTEPPKVPPASFTKLVEMCQGLHFATRFSSHRLFLVDLKDSEIWMTLCDNKLRNVSKTKIRTPRELLDLEIDKEARNLLRDYIALLCNRPFLGLAAMIATRTHYSLLSYLPNIFAGCIMPLDIGATLIAYRDRLRKIDEDIMREVIGFAETMVLGTFRRPDVAMQHGF